jgi:hypothetical protein
MRRVASEAKQKQKAEPPCECAECAARVAKGSTPVPARPKKKKTRTTRIVRAKEERLSVEARPGGPSSPVPRPPKTKRPVRLLHISSFLPSSCGDSDLSTSVVVHLRHRDATQLPRPTLPAPRPTRMRARTALVPARLVCALDVAALSAARAVGPCTRRRCVDP